MADLMENDGIEDEAFPPFPPPHSPGQGGPEGRDSLANGEEEGELSKLAEVPVAKRKGVRRPQPKLDSQRLISERGLPALRTLFDNVHFRGKGHEAENLRLLMQKMENWAHRLYPKLQFEDFIDKVEKLGNKKEVQTCLKRIRLDMPLTHEDFMDKDGDEEAALEMQVFGDPDPFSGTSFPSDLDGLVHSTPAPAAPSLTEEQCRRMELNRQRALERRLARQQQTGPSDSQTVDAPTSVSSTNTLNGSNTQDENVEGLDKEPGGSSTQQLHNNLAQKDSEPSAESSLCEEENEYNPSPDHQPSSRCEGGD
uniref:TIMELESS-interacting protein n=1 Tax=Monopterus albus TaxID=43700 RepID=UPI0009B33176|nr:TIMELESS-interacting protein [Monopterus albus]XP_020441274.1 TIMELESS-interacting protein [Monopterus albus]XP_020441276.1 TIMELESS-interacting protein [Monopterus albus]XP_020441277.1 TIMELESS-interacting protein [Monopterus albus]